MILITEENPPYNFTDPKTNELRGQITVLVRKIMAETKIPHSYQVLPFMRGYAKARDNANHCIFSINHTPERETDFEWVATLGIGGWAFFARADQHVEPGVDVEKILASSIVALKGSATLNSIRDAGALYILEAATSEDAAHILYRKRVDFWVSGLNNSAYLAKKLGYPAPKLIKYWKKAVSSLACAKNTRPDWVLEMKSAATKVLDIAQSPANPKQ